MECCGHDRSLHFQGFDPETDALIGPIAVPCMAPGCRCGKPALREPIPCNPCGGSGKVCSRCRRGAHCDCKKTYPTMACIACEGEGIASAYRFKE